MPTNYTLFDEIENFTNQLKEHHKHTVRLFLKADELKRKVEACGYLTPVEGDQFHSFIRLYDAISEGAIKNLTQIFKEELDANE